MKTRHSCRPGPMIPQEHKGYFYQISLTAIQIYPTIDPLFPSEKNTEASNLITIIYKILSLSYPIAVINKGSINLAVFQLSISGIC